MVKVKIEEGLVQAHEYVEHVDIILLLKLPPFSSLHQVLLSIRICNFKTLSSGVARMGVDGCNEGVEQTFNALSFRSGSYQHFTSMKTIPEQFAVVLLLWDGISTWILHLQLHFNFKIDHIEIEYNHNHDRIYSISFGKTCTGPLRSLGLGRGGEGRGTKAFLRAMLPSPGCDEWVRDSIFAYDGYCWGKRGDNLCTSYSRSGGTFVLFKIQCARENGGMAGIMWEYGRIYGGVLHFMLERRKGKWN